MSGFEHVTENSTVHTYYCDIDLRNINALLIVVVD
jgi:hypothetical protein